MADTTSIYTSDRLHWHALLHLLRKHYDAHEARAVGLLVLEQAFGVPAIDVYADKVRHFSADEQTLLQEMCTRLASGEPVQYVLGQATFMGRSYIVRPGVLIPRIETEVLVEAVTKTFAAIAPPKRILDLCTGSGILACEMARLFPKANVQGYDISPEALSVAQENSLRHAPHITWHQADLLSPTTTLPKADLIVCNPPYVCQHEATAIAPHVLQHEPHLALFVPDHTPLLFYERVASLVTQSSSQAHLFFEINEAYSHEVITCLQTQGYTDTTCHYDQYNKPRIVQAYWHT